MSSDLRSLSYDLASRALQDGTMQVTPQTAEEQTALGWMQSAELVQNSMLLQTAITASTTLSAPALVTNAKTTWSKRQSLLSKGWTQSQSGRDATAQQAVLNPCQSKEYFQLLLDHRDAVVFLEERGIFSHAQGAHYYNAIKSMVESSNFGSPAAQQRIHDPRCRLCFDVCDLRSLRLNG